MKTKMNFLKVMLTGFLALAAVAVSFVKASEGSCCLKKLTIMQESSADSGCCHEEKDTGHCGDEPAVCKCFFGQNMAIPAEVLYSGTVFSGDKAEFIHEQYSFLELKDIFRPPAV